MWSLEISLTNLEATINTVHDVVSEPGPATVDAVPPDVPESVIESDLYRTRSGRYCSVERDRSARRRGVCRSGRRRGVCRRVRGVRRSGRRRSVCRRVRGVGRIGRRHCGAGD